MPITADFAVQSYCFRAIKDHAAVAEAVRRIGLSAIELCRAHDPFDDPAAFEKVVAIYRDAGVRVPSLGVETLTGDAEAERRRFECARVAGCGHMSISFNPDTFSRAHTVAHELAEQFDMKLGIHNHGGRHWLGSTQMLAHVLAQTGPRIGLCLDTAWALDAGEDAVKMIERFADRLTAIHLKDFLFEPTRQPRDVVVGTGALDLPALVAMAKKIDFNGLTVLEYEGDVDDPIPALDHCVKAIRNDLG